MLTLALQRGRVDAARRASLAHAARERAAGRRWPDRRAVAYVVLVRDAGPRTAYRVVGAFAGPARVPFTDAASVVETAAESSAGRAAKVVTLDAATGVPFLQHYYYPDKRGCKGKTCRATAAALPFRLRPFADA